MDEQYQKGQDDFQEWLWKTIAEMRVAGFDVATLDELEQRTY